MGRGYWLPYNSEHLTACDGYYVADEAVYAPGYEEGWNKILYTLRQQLTKADRTFRFYGDWKSCKNGQTRFVLVYNHFVDVVVEDADDYVAVYVLVPETCTNPGAAKRAFPRYLTMVKHILCQQYPGHIRHRLNSQHTEPVG